jgi:hypothetical protein
MEALGWLRPPGVAHARVHARGARPRPLAPGHRAPLRVLHRMLNRGHDAAQAQFISVAQTEFFGGVCAALPLRLAAATANVAKCVLAVADIAS